MYTGGVFVSDILSIFNLRETSDDYKNLGAVCDRNIFYYAIYRDSKFLSETCVIALNNLIIKEANTDEKKRKILKYFKKYIPKSKNIADKDFNDIVKFVIEQFTYKIDSTKRKRILSNNLSNEIAESFIKSAKYISIDFSLATILINKTIDNIIKSVNKKGVANLGKNKKATINKLKYKNIMSSTILSTIEHLNLLLTYKDKNKNFFDMVFSNVRWIVKWYFEEYLKSDFKTIDKKAYGNFFSIKENENVAVYSMDELLKKGWTLEKFAKAMLNLFYATIDNLAEENTSTLEEMIEIIKSQPETNRLLIDSTGKAVGCWTFDPLFNDAFERDKKGEFYVKEFATDDTIPALLPGIHNIHFGAICLVDEYRNPTVFSRLLFSMIEYIEELALNGVFIGEICTQAYTKNGRSLAISLGLDYCCEHKDGHGKVYCGTMLDLSKKDLLRDFKVLRSLYKEKFEGSTEF